MPTLKKSEIWRGGASTKDIHKEATSLSVHSMSAIEGDERQGISLTTTIKSKGGGRTQVIVFIPQSAFSDLARAMCASSDKVAARAFAEAITKELKD